MGSDSGSSLKVKHGSNGVEVTNMLEASAQLVGEVIRDGEIKIRVDVRGAQRIREMKSRCMDGSRILLLYKLQFHLLL